jgi:hypothetical protein
MHIIGVDHTGSEPVLVIHFGDREERWSMDQVRAAALAAVQGSRCDREGICRGNEVECAAATWPSSCSGLAAGDHRAG